MAEYKWIPRGTLVIPPTVLSNIHNRAINLDCESFHDDAAISLPPRMHVTS